MAPAGPQVVQDNAASPDSSTTVPTHIGPYEIVGELDSGGEGRVFRARHTRLNSEAALKVLHRREQPDARREERFLDEARAASALNHPNIVRVYDFGTHEGRPYLVAELIEGRSLRDELEAGLLPMSRVLELATQIADGLAAAHHAGFVHRDLKPQNVMVAKGQAKIVDFGLATVSEASNHAAPVHTQTAPLTVPGTAPYMSPEQARGAAVDFRSDLFSFGAMLYEMAAGRRAFDRPTTIETLTAILHDEPPKLRDVNPRVPWRLQQIVDRCLAKSPDDRYASTADLRHDVKELRDGRVAGDEAPAPNGAPWWQRRTTWRLAARGAGVVAIAVAAWLAADAAAGDSRDLANYRIVPVATDDGYEGSPVWSPDGQTLAYIAERDGVMQVMARNLDSARSVPLTRAVSDCRSPMWSADGTRVYYISLAAQEDSLWSVSAAGGNPQVEIRDVAAAAMAPTGTVLAFLRDEGAFAMTLWLSSPPGAEPVRFAADWRGTAAVGISVMAFTPDGARLGLWSNDAINTDGAPDRPELWVFDVPSGRAQAVLPALQTVSRPHPFSWMPDGRRIVFGADRLGRSPGTHLWMADTVTGAMTALTASSTSEYEPSVSRDGTRIAFAADASHYDVIEIPVAGGPIVERRHNTSDDSDPAWSVSGRQFAYVTTRSGGPEIWLSDIEGAVEVPIVTRRSFPDDTALLSALALSPDGQRIVYQRRSFTGYSLWTSPVVGGPAVQLIPRARANYQDAPAWSPDGAWLAFTYIVFTSPTDLLGSRTFRLGKTRPGADGEVTEIRSDINYLSSPKWSPDGRWITVELQDGLYAVSPDGARQQLLSRDPWFVHTWSRDSRSVLAIRQSDENRLQLASIDLATQAVRVLNPDLGPVPPTTPPLRGFSLSPDGTTLLTSIARLRGDIHVLDGFERTGTPWSRLGRALSGWAGQRSTTSP